VPAKHHDLVRQRRAGNREDHRLLRVPVIEQLDGEVFEDLDLLPVRLAREHQDDLVLQRGNSERPLPPIGLRDVVRQNVGTHVGA
jgi:hypothetical protein